MPAPLPPVNGLNPSRQWLPAGPWATLYGFLQEHFPQVAPAVWQRRLAQNQVVDENGTPWRGDSPYRAGACIFYYREVADEPIIPFTAQIIYRDEHLLVVDKPHFLPVMPAGRFLRETLLVRLQRELAAPDLVPLHRLDRATAGLVMFSCNPATRGLYASLFQQRKVAKIYEAQAVARPGVDFPLTRRSRIVTGEPFFRMQEIPGAPNAETRIELIKPVSDNIALYRLHPLTGRKHQLRVHLAAIDRPILNDPLYPTINETASDDYSRPLQLLAKSLSFSDPLTGREHYFASLRTLQLNADSTHRLNLVQTPITAS